MKDQAERIERNALHQPIAQNRRSSEPKAENRKGLVQARVFPQTCPQREGYAGNAESQQRGRDDQEAEVVPHCDRQRACKGKLEQKSCGRYKKNADVVSAIQFASDARLSPGNADGREQDNKTRAVVHLEVGTSRS